jgi:hypothetical protein
MRWVRATIPELQWNLAPHKARFLRYRQIFSFTDRIVTGAESLPRRGHAPRKMGAVFNAKSADNNLLITL